MVGGGTLALVGRDGLAFASPGPDSRPPLPEGRRALAATAGPPTIPSSFRLQRADGSSCSISMEEYLKSVVPAEMPASWHPEALKAQAVAARTYAAAYVATYGYICATSACQNWNPATRDRRSDTAVDATRGELMTYQGGTIWAYYSSTCGGQTAASPDDASAYCRSVACGVYAAQDLSTEAAATAFWRDPWPASRPLAYCSASPLFRWGPYVVPKATEEEILGRTLSSIAVTARQYSGKARIVNVNEGGLILVSESSIKNALRTSVTADALPSANVILAYDGSNLTRWGGGYGHGIGLCQYGANGMANAGNGYKQILQHYYTGVAFVSVAPSEYPLPAARSYRSLLGWASRAGGTQSGAACG